MRFTKTLCLAMLTSLVVSMAHAGPREDAEYIVSQTVTRTLFEAALAAQRPLIIPAMQQNLANKGIVFSDIEGFADIFMEEFIDEFTEIMQRDTVALQLEMFSADELRDIAAFYKTPSGQALIANTGPLMQAGAQMGQVAGMEAGQNANGRIAKRLEEEGITLQNDSGFTKRLIDTLRGK